MMKADSIQEHLKEHPISGRWTTFNGAFQVALAVPEPYNQQKHFEALRGLGQDPEDLKCVYCGTEAATWDHLHNNVQEKRFSGFGNRIYNLVPSCRRCNERKGRKHWRAFLLYSNPPDREHKEIILAEFESKNTAERFGWDKIQREFPALADRYDKIIKEVELKLKEADSIAKEIRSSVSTKIKHS